MQALLGAGLKTQTALAEKIAEVEELDTAPKDLVNRVFRELPVDPSTLERVAHALAVPAHSLYLSSDEATYYLNEDDTEDDIESDVDADDSESPPASTDTSLKQPSAQIAQDNLANSNPSIAAFAARKKPSRFIAPLVGLFALLMAVYWLGPTLYSKVKADKNQQDFTAPNSVVIYHTSKDLEPAAKQLAELLPDTIHRTLISEPLIKPPILSANIANQFHADAVITLNLQTIGHYQFTQIYFYYNGEQHQLAAIHHTRDQLSHNPDLVAKLYLQPLMLALEGSALAPSISLAEQKDFMLSRQSLESIFSELNIKRAESLLNNLLEQQPEFYLAHAGLCEAYLYESWMGNEKQLLEKAEKHCALASLHQPNSPYTMVANGLLLRRTGQVDQSIDTFNHLLEIWPNDAEALMGLSISERTAYNQAGQSSSQLLDQALQHAELSLNLEANNWAGYIHLAALYKAKSQYENSVAALEKSVALHKNEMALVNLGSLRFCMGEIENSHASYLSAYELAPDSYLSSDFLGQSYYYTHDYLLSIKYRDQAIKKVGSGDGGIHKQWGNLGDSQRQQGDNKAAIDSYREALTIVKRDDLRGNIDLSTKVYYAYYFEMLHHLAPETFPVEMSPYNDEELSGLMAENTEIPSFLRLGIIFSFRGQQDLARNAFDIALNKCAGYENNPDLIAWRDN